jgi:hypothetical protein
MNINDFPNEILLAVFGHIEAPNAIDRAILRTKMRQVCHLWAQLIPIEHKVLTERVEYSQGEFKDIIYITYYPRGGLFEAMYHIWPSCPKLEAISIITASNSNYEAIYLAKLMPNRAQLANVTDVIMNFMPESRFLGAFGAIKRLNINCLPCLGNGCLHLVSHYIYGLIEYADIIKIKLRPCVCITDFIDSDGYLKGRN